MRTELKPSTTSVQRVTGVVLAGGLGRRMGGVDKGLLDCAGWPLVSYVLRRLRPQVGTILVSANRNHDRYAAFGYPLLRDAEAEPTGPLAGIASALQVISTDFLVTVPCDSPLLQTNYVARLLSAADRESADIACAYGKGRLQPVFALIRHTLANSLQTYLAGGHRKIENWYRGQALAIVDFSAHPEMFTNVNSPEDLAATAKLLENEPR